MLYRWRCINPALGEVVITAEDKLHARIGAAEFWNQPWTDIVYATTAECLGEAPKLEEPEKKTARKKKETTE